MRSSHMVLAALLFTRHVQDMPAPDGLYCLLEHSAEPILSGLDLEWSCERTLTLPLRRAAEELQTETRILESALAPTSTSLLVCSECLYAVEYSFALSFTNQIYLGRLEPKCQEIAYDGTLWYLGSPLAADRLLNAGSVDLISPPQSSVFRPGLYRNYLFMCGYDVLAGLHDRPRVSSLFRVLTMLEDGGQLLSNVISFGPHGVELTLNISSDASVHVISMAPDLDYAIVRWAEYTRSGQVCSLSEMRDFRPLSGVRPAWIPWNIKSSYYRWRGNRGEPAMYPVFNEDLLLRRISRAVVSNDMCAIAYTRPGSLYLDGGIGESYRFPANEQQLDGALRSIHTDTQLPLMVRSGRSRGLVAISILVVLLIIARAMRKNTRAPVGLGRQRCHP